MNCLRRRSHMPSCQERGPDSEILRRSSSQLYPRHSAAAMQVLPAVLCLAFEEVQHEITRRDEPAHETGCAL